MVGSLPRLHISLFSARAHLFFINDGNSSPFSPFFPCDVFCFLNRNLMNELPLSFARS